MFVILQDLDKRGILFSINLENNMDSEEGELQPKPNNQRRLLTIIVLCSILAAAIVGLVIVTGRKAASPQSGAPISENQNIQIPESTPEDVLANFIESITKLAEDVTGKTFASVSELITSTENQLLTIRVPREKQGVYMQLVLAMDTRNTETESVDTMKLWIEQELHKLIAS